MRRCLLILVWLCSNPTLAADLPPGRIHLLVQSSPLAGSQYHALEEVRHQLQVGMRLQLVREPDNPHDARAVRIDWQGHVLGYLPRVENTTVSRALDAGEAVEARIAKLREHRNPWRRLEVDIFLRL
jgi:hypothetical protein